MSGAPDTAPPAVLIDLDGTLVHTVDVWRSAYLQLHAELGLAAPPDLWERVAGRSMHGSLDVLGAAIAGRDRDALVTRLVDLAAAGLATGGWHWMPGARELLMALGSSEGPRPPLALVTSAWRAFTLPLLAAALEDPAAMFDAIVCGDDVMEGKPAPDSHLRAAELLGVAVDSCLVIEDSPTGVAAAEAAGMVTLVVPHAGTVAPAPGRAVRADLVGLGPADLTALHVRLRSEVDGRGDGRAGA